MEGDAMHLMSAVSLAPTAARSDPQRGRTLRASRRVSDLPWHWRDILSSVGGSTYMSREDHEQTRRHFEVVAEGLRSDIRQLAEGVSANAEALERSRAETARELAEIRSDMSAGFAAARADTAREFVAVRTEMAGGLTAVRAEMADGFTAVRAEMAEGLTAVRAEMADGFTAVRAEISASRVVRATFTRPRSRRRSN
jgi:hypothetical protein